MLILSKQAKQSIKKTFFISVILGIAFVGGILPTNIVDAADTRIFIDPGHGGSDIGASANGLQEKNVALDIALKTRDILNEQYSGHTLKLSRTEDVTKSLDERTDEANDWGTTFFISIHLNSLPSTRWRGAQTFFYPRFPENIQLARAIQDEIIINMKNTERQALQLNTIYLLKYAKVPGALVEIGFLSNEAERELLKQRTYQQQIAASIYKGILHYLENPPDMEDET